MENPVVVEVLRGAVVESRHRGAAVACDADGGVVLAFGGVERPVFPRSAVKAIQALPLVESGAADGYALTTRELALACASHSGEARHTETAEGMLRKAGLLPDALECGAHWPTSHRTTIALAREGGQPSGLHNNCSGKHSGFLCVCCHEGIDHRGYVGRTHPLQEMVRETVEQVTGAAHVPDMCGTDGCSIPTYAVPLRNLAQGFARMATGQGLSAARAAAARRLMAACMAEPWFVAGTNRHDTKMMEAGRGRVFTKTGAEGVFCAALPQQGLGIALKCDDGTARAAEVMIAAIIERLLAPQDEIDPRPFYDLARPQLRNWNGIAFGAMRPAGPLIA